MDKCLIKLVLINSINHCGIYMTCRLETSGVSNDIFHFALWRDWLLNNQNRMSDEPVSATQGRCMG